MNTLDLVFKKENSNVYISQCDRIFGSFILLGSEYHLKLMMAEDLYFSPEIFRQLYRKMEELNTPLVE